MRVELKHVRSAVPETLRASGIQTFSDLFCGIGGFHYAAHDLGLHCVFACDSDEACRNQYLSNFGLLPKGDITGIDATDVPDHDLLFAGFPCQPFSIIGDRKAMADDRGTLIHEVTRILAAKRPKAFVLENVRQFATIKGGAVLKATVKALRDAGYKCDWKVLNALGFGLPQKRERIIIVGFLDAPIDLFQWPVPKKQCTALSELLERDPDEKHYVSEAIRKKRHERHKANQKPMIWHENKGGNISSHPFSCALRANASYNYLLVDGERRITPREQLRLQGFPERFRIVGGDSKIKKTDRQRGARANGAGGDSGGNECGKSKRAAERRSTSRIRLTSSRNRSFRASASGSSTLRLSATRT